MNTARRTNLQCTDRTRKLEARHISAPHGTEPPPLPPHPPTPPPAPSLVIALALLVLLLGLAERGV